MLAEIDECQKGMRDCVGDFRPCRAFLTDVSRHGQSTAVHQLCDEGRTQCFEGDIVRLETAGDELKLVRARSGVVQRIGAEQLLIFWGLHRHRDRSPHGPRNWNTPSPAIRRPLQASADVDDDYRPQAAGARP